MVFSFQLHGFVLWNGSYVPGCRVAQGTQGFCQFLTGFCVQALHGVHDGLGVAQCIEPQVLADGFGFCGLQGIKERVDELLALRFIKP